MTKEFLKMARAQAAITAYRDALSLVQHRDAKEVERELKNRLATKKIIIDDWKRKRSRRDMAVSDVAYRRANKELLENS
jgi:hypothetical protein